MGSHIYNILSVNTTKEINVNGLLFYHHMELFLASVSWAKYMVDREVTIWVGPQDTRTHQFVTLGDNPF